MLLEECIEFAREGDTAWTEFVEELEVWELELLNDSIEIVRQHLLDAGFRLELRMP
jgi:hypothetical protein